MQLKSRHLRVLAVLSKGRKRWSELERELGTRLSSRHLWKSLGDLEKAGYIKIDADTAASGSKKKYYRLNPKHEKEIKRQLELTHLEDSFTDLPTLVNQILTSPLSVEEKFNALWNVADEWEGSMNHFWESVVHLALIASLHGQEKTSRKLRDIAVRDYAAALQSLLNAAFSSKLAALAFAAEGADIGHKPDLVASYPGNERILEMAKPPRLPSFQELTKYPFSESSSLEVQDQISKFWLEPRKRLLEEARARFGPDDFR